MRTREDKADLGPPGDRGVRVTRSLGCGWDPPGVALTPGARVARHAHRHHVRHSGHVRRQRLRARRCVARPHRARASSRGAPRGVAVLDIVPPFFFPSASSRGTIMTTSDAPRVAPRSAPISRPDLARRLTTLPRAPASLPPQPPRRSAPTPPGTRARERRPRSSSEARLRHRRDDASRSDARQSIARSLPLRPLPRVSLTASPPPSSSALPSAFFRTYISGPRLRSARSRRGLSPSPRRRWRTRRAPCTRSPPSSARRR